MNISVIYASKSGATKKLADAICEVVGVEPIDAHEPHILEDTDLLFIGCGISGGKPSQELVNYIDNLPMNHIRGAVVFSTSFTGKDDSELVVNGLKAKGIEVYPKRFACKGQWLFWNKNRPNDKDIEKVKNFTKQVLKSVGVEIE